MSHLYCGDSLFELTDVKMYLRAPPVIPGHVSAVLLAAPLDAPAHVPGAGGAGRGGRVGGAGRQLAVVPRVARHTAAQVHTPTLNNRAANDPSVFTITELCY